MSYWAPGAVALVAEELGIPKSFVLLITFNSWKEASAFNADLWRIWNDGANFRVL